MVLCPAFFSSPVSLPLIRAQKEKEWPVRLMMTNCSFGLYLGGCGNLGLPFVCAHGRQAGIQRCSWSLAGLQFGVCLTLFGNTLCRWRHTPLPGPRAKETKAPGAKATSLICKSLILFSCLLQGALTLAQSLSRHNSSIFFTDKLRDQVNLACLTIETVSGLRYDQLEYMHTVCVYVWMHAYVYNYM